MVHPEAYWGFRSRLENRETRDRLYLALVADVVGMAVSTKAVYPLPIILML